MTLPAPVLILQHVDSAPPALLADWAQERGISYEIHHVDQDPAGLPALDGRPFVVSLGSDHSPNERELPDVAHELELLREAANREIPILGLCYGAQALAVVLGGEVEHAPEAELGWHRVDSSAPELIEPGPWLQWHYDRFTVPPGATELARSPRGPQAFAQGPHLGVQFHPEATVEIVEGWAHADRRRLDTLGIADAAALTKASEAQARAAREAAFRLFDAFRELVLAHADARARSAS
jgi:GMP synthase-like glutamine amidotransferase